MSTTATRSRSDSAPGLVRPLREAQLGLGTVYLVHPGGSAASVHRSLAGALPQGVGLTVLDLAQLPEYHQGALDGGRTATALATLADRLAGQLAELTGAAPDSPWSLGGWAFGGVLAQALVERLPADRRPAELVLLDSIAPVAAHRRSGGEPEPAQLLRRFAMYLGVRHGRRIELDPQRLAGCDPDRGLLLVLDAAIGAGAVLPDTPPPGLRKLYETYADALARDDRLIAAHRPGPASVPLVLVTAEHGLLPGDDTLGWGQLAGAGLTVHRCAGDHYTMLIRPDATALIAGLLRPTGRD
ncbi:thioesterase [Kitasatospora acidiphila]|uniref:Thioesterase n=1 Tax=Kitasatospora acidiphila TaxID=2567942 RepID=A0A540W7H9_9ACTN|nr:thioesterase domain-containing protein [Kitasatospora acidiphila]TQF04980.1 thioesterase [Kitasatospora acidiphila]